MNFDRICEWIWENKKTDEIKINTLALNVFSSQKAQAKQNPSHLQFLRITHIFPIKLLACEIGCACVISHIFVCSDYGNFNLNFYFQLQRRRKSHISAESSIFVELQIYAAFFFCTAKSIFTLSHTHTHILTHALSLSLWLPIHSTIATTTTSSPPQQLAIIIKMENYSSETITPK